MLPEMEVNPRLHSRALMGKADGSAGVEPGRSSGSTLTIDALWLLPIHSVGGFVELSTSTRRMFVLRGRRYSTVSPVVLLTRATRSLNMPPVQMLPFLSRIAS